MADEVLSNVMASEKVIFTRLFKQDDEVYDLRNTLKAEINTASAFNNEYYVFYTLISNYPKIKFSKEFLRIYLMQQKGFFQRATAIDYTSFTFGDTDPYVSFTDSCMELFGECCNGETTTDLFNMHLVMYKETYVNRASLEILENGAQILSEGKKIGRKTYRGYDGLRAYMAESFVQVDSVYEKSKRRGSVTYGVTPEDEEESITKLEKLGDYGIAALNDVLGIYEGEMHSILAPSKGGKTRFCAYVLEHILCDYGQNCLIWSAENGLKGFECLLRARHFNRLYNSGATNPFEKHIINDGMIRGSRAMSDEIKKMEEASWAEFKVNEAYGRLTSMDADLNLDTFIDKIDKEVKAHDIKVICVDYLQLIGAGMSGITSPNERIAEAYKQMLQYCKHEKIAGIFPCQFKQTAVGTLTKMNDAELMNAELRDTAGGSYEVIKTPDLNMALFGTVTSMRNGEMKLIALPSRNMPNFDPIDLYVELGACTFMSVDKTTVVEDDD